MSSPAFFCFLCGFCFESVLVVFILRNEGACVLLLKGLAVIHNLAYSLRYR